MPACTNKKILLACPEHTLSRKKTRGSPFYVHGKNQIELPVYVK
jgi:hypothetical protein